jgi:hypothetical protein
MKKALPYIAIAALLIWFYKKNQNNVLLSPPQRNDNPTEGRPDTTLTGVPKLY